MAWHKVGSADYASGAPTPKGKRSAIATCSQKQQEGKCCLLIMPTLLKPWNPEQKGCSRKKVFSRGKAQNSELATFKTVRVRRWHGFE
jgi:hypothetical protein